MYSLSHPLPHLPLWRRTAKTDGDNAQYHKIELVSLGVFCLMVDLLLGGSATNLSTLFS